MGNLSKYFDSSEFKCADGCGFGTQPGDVSLALLEKLEAMRPFVGPMKVNSGCRCMKHNTAIGGSALSAHMSGQAADIRSLHSSMTYKLVKYALLAGFRRIGIERGCVHLDVSEALAQDVLFSWERLDHI